MKEVREYLTEHWQQASLLIFVVLLLGAPSLAFPFGRDQGSYAYTAYRVLQGDAMYSEAYAFKPPGTIFVHMLSQFLFGHSMVALRIVDILTVLLSSFLLYLFSLQLLKNKWAAVVCGALFARMYFQMGYWHLAQTDGWSIAPSVGMMLLASRLWRRGAPIFCRSGALTAGAAAFLVGVSFILKYVFGIFLIVLLVSEAARLRSSKTDIVKTAFVIGVGFLIPLLLTALYLCATGSIEAFWNIQFHNVFHYSTANSETVGHYGLNMYAALIAGWFPLTFLLSCLGLLGMGIRLFATRLGRESLIVDKAQFLLVAGWLLGTMISTIIQGKFFGYHAVPSLAPVSILAVAAIYLPGRALLRTIRAPKMLLLLLALGLVLTLPPQHLIFLDAADIVSGRTSIREYWMSGKFDISSCSFANNLLLSEYLQRTTQPEDAVFVWGQEPVVNFLSRRYSGSRHPYHQGIVAKWVPDDVGKAFLRTIRNHPPTVFVISSNDPMPVVTGWDLDSMALLKRHTDIYKFIEDHYRLEKRIGPFYVMCLIK